MISGGFSGPPTDTKQTTLKSVEIINPNAQKAEKDLPISVAQHCLVHVFCYYTFLAGGTADTGKLAKNFFTS